jgi:hypothetical protein
MPMPLIPDIAVFQRKLATLPLASYQAGETVLSAASTTGQLLILKEGKVAVVRQPVQRHHHARRGIPHAEEGADYRYASALCSICLSPSI